MQILAHKPMHRRAVLIIFIVGWLAFNLWSLMRYPSVTCDEAFYMRAAMRYISPDTSLFRSGAIFFLPHGRTYLLIMGVVLRVTKDSLVAARALSVAGWIATVVATYWLGVRVADRQVGGWAAVLTAVTWLGLHAGHRARPDVLAVAASTALVTLVLMARERRSILLSIITGFLLVFSLDIHPLTLYIALPLAGFIIAWHIQDQAFWPLMALIGGGVVGGAVLFILHFGPLTPDVLAMAIHDPLGLIRTQNLLDEGSGSLLSFISWFASFWWGYYAWLAPLVSLPQAALFVFGVVGGFAWGNEQQHFLGWLILLSSGLFAVINNNYTAPPGYALLWVPLYMILGVSVLLQVANRLPLGTLFGRWTDVKWGGIALAGLWLLYVAGDVYLTTPNAFRVYQQAEQVILAQARSGDSLLASSVWWPALHDDLTFIDEVRIAPENSSLWWNSVPEDAVFSDPLAPLTSSEAANLEAEAYIAEQLRTMHPDLILDDGHLSCQSDVTPLAAGITSYVEAMCRPVTVLALPGYGLQTLYRCS